MASYAEFKDSIKDDALTGYRNLLADVKYCINLMDELESERNYKKLIPDWAVGEMSSINVSRTKNNLKKLHNEIEKGLRQFTKLFSLMTGAKMIELSFQTTIKEFEISGFDTSALMEMSNNASSSIEKFSNRITAAVNNLANTGVFVEKEIKTDKYSLVKSGAQGAAIGGVGGTALGIAGAVALGTVGVVATGGTILVAGVVLAAVTGAISSVAYLYAHPKGKERGIKYQELKFLSDSLNNVTLLSEFEAQNIFLTQVTKGLKENISLYKQLTLNTSLVGIRRLTLEKEERIKAISHSSTRNSATVDNGIKATRIYDRVLRENIQSFQSDPEMSEALRKKMATKLAETACRTFLMEVLNYSETEANECIRNIQN